MDDKLKEKVKQKLEQEQTVETVDDVLKEQVKQRLQEERANEILEEEVPAGDEVLEPEVVWRQGFGRVSTMVLAQYFRQMSVLLQAGFPILRALRVAGHGRSHRLMSASLTRVAMQVENGSALWRAMEQHPRVFPPIVISTVRAGEASGTLESALEYLADNLEYEAQVRTKVRSAFDYPIFFTALTGVILLFMFLVVLPRFEVVYQQLSHIKKIESSYFSTLLIIKTWVPWITLVAIIGTIVAWTTLRSRKYMALERLKLRFPVFGKLLLLSDLTRFSKTLSVQARSSVPILESLRLCKLVVDNREIENLVGEIETNVEQGGHLADPLNQHPLIPRAMVDLMEVGEESGSLAVSMEHLSKMFQSQLENTISRLTALLQPILLLCMGIMVVGVFVGMITPYFEVLDTLQSSGFGGNEVQLNPDAKRRTKAPKQRGKKTKAKAAKKAKAKAKATKGAKGAKAAVGIKGAKGAKGAKNNKSTKDAKDAKAPKRAAPAAAPDKRAAAPAPARRATAPAPRAATPRPAAPARPRPAPRRAAAPAPPAPRTKSPARPAAPTKAAPRTTPAPRR